jgi:hypothetical protein
MNDALFRQPTAGRVLGQFHSHDLLPLQFSVVGTHAFRKRQGASSS